MSYGDQQCPQGGGIEIKHQRGYSAPTRDMHVLHRAESERRQPFPRMLDIAKTGGKLAHSWLTARLTAATAP